MEKKVEKQTNSALLTAGLLDFYFFLLLPLLDSLIFAAVWEETFTINGVTICLGGMPHPGEDQRVGGQSQLCCSSPREMLTFLCPFLWSPFLPPLLMDMVMSKGQDSEGRPSVQEDGFDTHVVEAN